MKREDLQPLERRAWVLTCLIALIAVSACVCFGSAWYADVIWHMSNNSATCDYVQKHLMRESKKLREELLARISFGCPPQEVDWVFNPRLSSLPDEYLFKDEHSPDIEHLKTQYPTQDDGRDWFMAHFSAPYPLQADEAPAPMYTLSFSGSDGVDITTDSIPDHWVYIVSKETFPSHYAVEFDFRSATRIKEQLQLCFHADSLAERRRFIWEYGENVFFQIVSHAFFMEPMKSTPAVNRPGEWVHIRMEVVGNKAEVITSELCKLVIFDFGHIHTVKNNASGGGLYKRSKNIEQGGLARAGLTHNGNIFAFFNTEIYVFKCRDTV